MTYKSFTEEETPTDLVGNAVPTEILCQEDAARLLGVSSRYLRDSGAPKLLLQGNGPQGRYLVRYVRSEVLGWAMNQRGRN